MRNFGHLRLLVIKATFRIFMVALLVSCNSREQSSPLPSFLASKKQPGPQSLAEVRKGFKTRLLRKENAKQPVPQPPADLFKAVSYDSAIGRLAAYLTVDPKDGAKHPAIIWIIGGDCNTIEDVWTSRPENDDQSASAFRKAGIVMMFPSLRGGNNNPGFKEGFFGEVDDVIAAAEFLARQPFVDATRIYLGGHSTGGTLAMLVAESSSKFRAVFSFGPVADVSSYGSEILPFDIKNDKELMLRAPAAWMALVKVPLFVFEGDQEPSNLESWQYMSKENTSPVIHFLLVPGADHFATLGRVNPLIATRILRDTGAVTNLKITQEELAKAVQH